MKALLIDADSHKDVYNNAIAKFLTHYTNLGWDIEVELRLRKHKLSG